jgi:hypothetical protein
MTLQAIEIALVAVCLFLGGVVKGATGAGAPLFAVPAVTALFDLRLAIILMVLPNILTNVWQAWSFRDNLRELSFLRPYLLSGIAGIFVGTWLLAIFPEAALSAVLCAALLAYVIWRMARPDWVLSREGGAALAVPAGALAGALQGAAGLSAPASLTFLSSMRLSRPAFAGTISLLFVLLATAQLPALWVAGMLTPWSLMLSALAIAPIVLGMTVGTWLARFMSQDMFQRVVLLLLAGVALLLFCKTVVTVWS